MTKMLAAVAALLTVTGVIILGLTAIVALAVNLFQSITG